MLSASAGRLRESMSGTTTKLPISKRWPLAFWFGAAFCFFIFPVFLLDVGLENMLTTRSEVHRQTVYRELGTRLERLLQYSNARHYYSALLKRIFEFAARQADPIKYLRIALPHLKARNPDVFRFIIWDHKGNSIEDLSDEKGFRYIVKTIFEVLREVNRDVVKNYPGEPQNLSLVEKRLNFLRSYLGAFLIPEKLNLPMLRGSLSECILASGDPEKSYFWYQVDDRFTMMATLNGKAIESDEYLKKLVDAMNNAPGARVGIVDLLRDGAMHTSVSDELKPELLLGLAKFENFTQQQLETDNLLLMVKILNPFVRSVAFVEKSAVLFDADTIHKRILAITALVILLLSAMMGYLIFREKRVFSIRWKLALLFLYANGLPLLILGFIGYEYLQQTRGLLLDRAFDQVSGLIADFDTRFETIKTETADYLNQHIDAVNKEFGGTMVSQKSLDELLKKVNRLKPFDFVVADRNGKLHKAKVPGRKANVFFASMSKTMLNYFNFNEYTPQHLFKEDEATSGARGSIKAEKFLSGKTIIFHRILQRIGKVHPEQMAQDTRQYYWNALGDFDNRVFNLLVGITWDFFTMQESYVSKSIDSLNQNTDEISFYGIVEANGVTYPSAKNLSREIFGLFRQTFSLRTLYVNEVVIDGRQYAAYGTIGRELDQVAMVGLYPLDRINSQIGSLQWRLIIFALLSLSLTTGVGLMLSAQFMEPVRELERGVQAIGRQDFRYRLPVKTADEFGRLSGVFNSAIESLEDLEVARIVQENLFPQEPLSQNGLRVFGCSVAMTRLGGDYYDFFTLDDSNVGILMGDVAGHGVPAALLMAMAKASVLLSDEDRRRPAAMLASLHKVIHRVKSSKIKRMMTCQYFSINSKTGSYLVSNAGHCFPALIRRGGEDIELLKLVGTPLGITKKPKYEDAPGQLEPGDIVLLYTDGIIESHNAEGVEMGFDRFAQMLQQQYDPDLETYYQKLFSAYKQWSPAADDDITMILIKFSEITGEVSV